MNVLFIGGCIDGQWMKLSQNMINCGRIEVPTKTLNQAISGDDYRGRALQMEIYQLQKVEDTYLAVHSSITSPLTMLIQGYKSNGNT